MRFVLMLLVVTNLPLLARAEMPARKSEALRHAVTAAIPLLERGARGSMEKRSNCFTCHNQAYPLIALAAARDRGFAIDESHFQEQVAFIARFLQRNRTSFLEGRGTGGQVATAGTALWALEVGQWEPDEASAAVSEYLLQFSKSPDHWIMTSHRPPTEHSHFTANYLAIRGLLKYATDEQQDRRTARFDQARAWLAAQRPEETEDHVYRLWALKLVDSEAATLQTAREDLLSLQRSDGGWGQLEELPSDAYATATALVALHSTGELQATDHAYQRGVEFLLRTQLDDGSWYVRSRSKPFQVYFESGFPHGKDQFISISATSFAVTALALACPPQSEQPSQ